MKYRSNLTGNAIVYIRASLDADKQANTPKGQLNTCEEWAIAHGFNIKLVVEERITGKKDPMDRKGFQKVLGSLEKGDVVLVQCRDRIARKTWMSLKVSEHIVDDLGCDIMSADEGGYKGNEVLAAVKDAIAQEERNKTSLRTKRAQKVLKDEGRVYAAIPLGMKPDEDNVFLIPNESEIQAMETIISLRESGMKYTDIIAECIKQNIQTREGNVPSQQTLSRWCKGVIVSKPLPRAKRKSKRTLGEVSPLLKHEVLRLRSIGLSYRKIATTLNEMGATNSIGGEIVHTQVARIIKRSENEG